MARHAAEGAEKAGAEVRLRRVARTAATTGEHEATDARAAHAEAASHIRPLSPTTSLGNAVLHGSPTCYGNIAGQLKTFIDSGPWMGEVPSGVMGCAAVCGFAGRRK